VLDTFLEHPFFLNRHRQAPLLKERESFLNHLQQQGTSRKALRNLSAELLQVVRLLKHTIRAWLGHVSIDTTNIYAESDLEMKAKALGMCETKLRQPRKRWRDNPDLLKFLAQL